MKAQAYYGDRGFFYFIFQGIRFIDSRQDAKIISTNNNRTIQNSLNTSFKKVQIKCHESHTWL